MIGLILFDLKIPMWKLINELMPWSFYYLLFIFLEIDVLVLIPNIPWMGPWRDGFERILVRLWHSGFERIFFGMNWCLGSTKVVNSAPYRSVRLEYTVPASNLVRSTPLFRTEKNTGRTGQFRAIPVGTEKVFFFL